MGVSEEGIPPGVVNITLSSSGHNQNYNCDDV